MSLVGTHFSTFSKLTFYLFENVENFTTIYILSINCLAIIKV